MPSTTLLAVLTSLLLLPGAMSQTRADDVHGSGMGGGARAAVTVSLAPTVTIEGGTPTTRTDAIHATERYVSNGYELPDLVVRLHDDEHGCEGHRGLFHFADGKPVIDLCFGEEFLALHELGHAWEYFNLDDTDRHAFQRAVGAPTWNSQDVPHKFRAVEIAAATMADGLLSIPATPGSNWNRTCVWFEALTGGPPPRQTTGATAAVGTAWSSSPRGEASVLRALSDLGRSVLGPAG